MNYYPNFGELLDQYLTAKDRPGTWLAKRLDVNPATVSRWRNGESRPGNPEVVIQVADLLGVHGEERHHFMHAAGYGYIEKQHSEDEEEVTCSDNTTGQQNDSSQSALQTDEIACAKRIASEEYAPEQRMDNRATTIDADKSFRIGLRRIWASVVEVVLWSSQHLTVLFSIISVVVVATIVGRWFMWAQPGFSSQANVQQFAIGEWKNLTPGSAPHELVIIEDTQRILRAKLNQVPALQSKTQHESLLPIAERDTLDLWIVGNYRKSDRVELVAELYGRNGEYIDTVSVHDNRTTIYDDNIGITRICLLDLQHRLATTILEKLNIPVESQLLDEMEAIPTHSCEALHKNNDAAKLILQGDFATAKRLLDQALALDPEYADAINNLGQFYYYQHEWSAAIAQYQRALAIDNRVALYHYNLALAQERQGNYTAAIESYTAAITIDPFYPQALNNLGFVYLLLEQPEEALLPLQRGLEADAKLPALHKNLGRAYFALGDLTAARSALQSAIELFAPTPYAEAIYYLALTEHETGKIARACIILQGYLPLATFDDGLRASSAQEMLITWNCD